MEHARKNTRSRKFRPFLVGQVGQFPNSWLSSCCIVAQPPPRRGWAGLAAMAAPSMPVAALPGGGDCVQLPGIIPQVERATARGFASALPTQLHYSAPRPPPPPPPHRNGSRSPQTSRNRWPCPGKPAPSTVALRGYAAACGAFLVGCGWAQSRACGRWARWRPLPPPGARKRITAEKSLASVTGGVTLGA